GDECADDLSFGLHLELTEVRDHGAAKPLEELLDRTTATVGIACQETSQALGSEPRRLGRGRKLGQEGKCDRRIDVPENDGRARPEAVQECTELVGQRDALCDEIVATTHERTQCTSFIRERPQRMET